VRNESQVRDLVLFAETTFGGVTVLVNNASAAHGGEAIEEWRDSIETDLLAYVPGRVPWVLRMRASVGSSFIEFGRMTLEDALV
jgi:NAD(P)-dependent dehydrogenase (short-subunit alcohol dehydrogenase family)